MNWVGALDMQTRVRQQERLSDRQEVKSVTACHHTFIAWIMYQLRMKHLVGGYSTSTSRVIPQNDSCTNLGILPCGLTEKQDFQQFE